MDDGAGGELQTVLGADEDVPTLLTSYTADQGIKKGLLYRFRCRVRNSIGWSAWSSPDTYVLAAVVPGRPAAPQFVSATATTITLQFSIPEDAGGSPLTLFELYVNDGNDSNDPATLVSTYTTNSLTHTLTTAADALTTGLIYKFKFRAINSIGNSEYSDTARYALVATPTAPSAPTNLVAQTSETQIGFEWAQVALTAGQETGQAILGYQAYMMEVNAVEGEDAASLSLGEYKLVYDGSSNPETTSLLVKTLNGQPVRAGFEYLLKVRARFLNGYTADSAVTSVRACSAPSLRAGAVWAPSLVSTSQSTMTIAWSEPSQASGPADGCSITGYRLHMSSDSGVSYSEIDSALVRDKPNLHEHAVQSSNFDTAGQTDVGKTFLFKLEAVNVAGVLLSGSVGIVLADAPAAPASGPSSDATQTTAEQILFSVATIDAADISKTGGTGILSYSLEVDDGAGSQFQALYGNDSDSLSTQYLLKIPEMRGKVFRARYRVRNAVGWSGYSPVTETLAASLPAAPPAAPEFVAATSTSISFLLQRSEDNGGSSITSHELYIDDGAAGAFSKVTSYDGSATSFTILQATETALVSGRVYRVKLRAVNVVGSSEFSGITSAALAALPAQANAPARVTALSTESKLVLQWTPPSSSDSPGGDIIGYRLEMDDGRGGEYSVIYDGYNAASLTQYVVGGDQS